MSNQRLFGETKSRLITSIIHQCQLWLYGHVARCLEADLACQVVSIRDNPAWRPRGHPQSLLLGQVDASRRVIWYGKGACMETRAG